MSLADKFKSLVEECAGGVIERVTAEPDINHLVNAGLISHLVEATAGRPLPYSLWTGRPIGVPYAGGVPEASSDYVTWSGLTDRRFSGRHLPPVDDATIARLPPIADVVALFERKAFVPSTTTTTLLCYFAQWFTDSFLRTDGTDTRLNTSNHEIDLCQIYGLDAETAALLRTSAGGKLRTSADGLYPAHLFDVHGALNPQFATLPYLVERIDGKSLEDVVLGTLDVPAAELLTRKQGLYATGLERGNSTILYTAISSIFLREHNRLCDLLAAAYPGWDEDRLFQTARNINIVLLLKLTINEYINHLAGAPFKLSLQRSFAEKTPWYRTNRIAIEFDLLYRWHSLVPDAVEVDGHVYTAAEYRFNNAVLEQHGAEKLIAAASRQPAGRLGMGNSPAFLKYAEASAHALSRAHRLQSFTAYQRCFGETPVKSFKELTGDATLATRLSELYASVDDVEFAVGLFAQHHDDGSTLPATLNTMVAVDAFSQILTNPLLASGVYGPQAFSQEGVAVIEGTDSFQQLVLRNCAPGSEAVVFASFDLRLA
jgi:prostaglandin-endoperoxide synthase 2